MFTQRVVTVFLCNCKRVNMSSSLNHESRVFTWQSDLVINSELLINLNQLRWRPYLHRLHLVGRLGLNSISHQHCLYEGVQTLLNNFKHYVFVFQGCDSENRSPLKKIMKPIFTCNRIDSAIKTIWTTRSVAVPWKYWVQISVIMYKLKDRANSNANNPDYYSWQHIGLVGLAEKGE